MVVSPPVYDSFFGFLDAIGRRRVEAPLTAEGRLDPAALDRAFAAATASGERAAYLLCNPQNPTGAVHIRRGARVARRARPAVRRAGGLG